jgi:DNA-binding MarR family transcriptional regulator
MSKSSSKSAGSPKSRDPANVGAGKSAGKSKLSREIVAGLLGFFYPIHYGISMETETRMRLGRISRQQAAVLWLIESKVGPEGWMRRRVVEQMLRSWFECSKPHVSQLLKELGSPPLALIKQMQNPTSAREKLIALSPKGREFFRTMIEEGIAYLEERLSHLTPEMAVTGINFYSAISYKPPGLDGEDEFGAPKAAPRRRNRPPSPA